MPLKLFEVKSEEILEGDEEDERAEVNGGKRHRCDCLLHR